ncbi:opioid-binding protein/cell adhesion molecule homolog [Asterias amurensis]|uniref:opioid-binding protein/cell adhesion molecule homolog n=1 Tax=Asterias amurensis TaxID=7602 RepID=UPI003AB587EB
MNPKTVLVIFFVAVINAPTSHAERKVVVHDRTFNLTCRSLRYSGGGAEPIFVWRKNEDILVSDQYFNLYNPVTTSIAGTTARQSTSILEVVPLLPDSNTNISCKVIGIDNQDVDRLKSWTLLVERQPPRIIPPPEDTTFVEGTSSTLNCTSIYDVNITWSMGGKPFGEVVLLDSLADGGRTVSVVMFNALRSQHQRVLKCVIPSAVEGANVPPPATEVVLSIVYPPFITSGRVREKPNTFWCEVDANPAANISWVGPNDAEIATGNQRWVEGNRTRSELEIDPAFATGVGGYTCIASNAYGNSSAVIPLPKDRLLLIVGVSAGVFTFGVVFIFLVFLALMKWRPCEVAPPDPIYSTVPVGTLGLTKRISTFATGTWKRGSLFGSPQRSTLDLDVINRPQLEAPKLDK